MDEWLNERDANGNGIRVKATYYVQAMFDDDYTQDSQIKSKIDNPVEQFFAFDLVKQENIESLEDGQQLSNFEVQDSIKMVWFPLARNKILVRFENLVDETEPLFQNVSLPDNRFFVNMSTLATDLWNKANQEHPVQLKNITFTEKSITGNMDIAELNARKIHWKIENPIPPMPNSD